MNQNPADQLNAWRMKVHEGRQTWHYLQDESLQANWPQTAADKYWLGVYKDTSDHGESKTAIDAARKGLRFAQQLQTEDGHFAGEYGGPMFLIPGLAITMYITGASYEPGHKEALIRYICNRAHPEDGGWGIHTEGISTVFGTALNYVALRLLGVSPDHPVCVKARDTLHKLGGATGVPAWGKFWLSVLNAYDWEGCNPIPPELWVLPYAAPIQAGRMWCHTRMVYLPMGYLYGVRYQAPLDELIESIRDEIYIEPYESICWPDQRNNVASVDLYAPHSGMLDFVNWVASIYEKIPNGFLRNYALKEVLYQIRCEDENTDYLDLGPVNKVMNMLIVWLVDGPDSDTFQRHLKRIPDFLWMSHEGMMMNGTNGSQLWDTAFFVQAAFEGGLANEKEFHSMIRSAHSFLDVCQIRRNMDDHERCYRHISKGAWPFSTRDQSYTVSDCTAEGLKSVLYLQNRTQYTDKLIDDERLFDAVNVLLSMPNSDGGFASYEKRRGPFWLELLNPAEVFGNIMIEYCYPECTTAVLLGLTTFKKYYPEHRADEIDKVISNAVNYIRKAQKPDGSWFGSWGICFTYATFFAVESLASIGESYESSDNLKRACDFLVSKQMQDGGWGESYRACEINEWVNHEQSQTVQTAWAILALLAANYPDQEVIRRGVQLIMSRQKRNGEWEEESILGVFNKNCMISYPNYKFIFPIWALSRYHVKYERS